MQFNSVTNDAQRETAMPLAHLGHETRDAVVFPQEHILPHTRGIGTEPSGNGDSKAMRNAVDTSRSLDATSAWNGRSVDPMPYITEQVPGAVDRRSRAASLKTKERVGCETNRQAETSSPLTYYRAVDIARAMNLSKKVIQGIAAREQWPSHQCGNRFEFAPPEKIAQLIVARPDLAKDISAPKGVCYADIFPAQQQVVLLREKAVLLYHASVRMEIGKELSLKLVSQQMREDHPLFGCCPNSLRSWIAKYTASGIDGLVDQKRGVVGRKPFAAMLTSEQILRGRAAAIEHGAAGRTNAARAFRELVAAPDLHGEARQFLHGEHPSKSYVAPSLRDAFRSPELTVTLAQVGPHAADLDGPYSECNYDKTPAGKAFTCDDMTANVYVWTEWPNEKGFLLIRPQILAAMDVGSMSWLTIRAVIRSRGQYTKDDAWGLIGDIFDQYGIYPIAVLEGGIWQSNAFVGHKTNLEDDARIGGLRSLGVHMFHARTPRAKIIENAFNNLQYAADRCIGYCGRAEREDLPEEVKRHKYEVEHGQAHPSKYFLHINQYSEHLAKVMEQLNNERNDGKILRGMSPAEKWANDKPAFATMPESGKWMYRSALNIVLATRNGVRITQGSGKYQLSYSYQHPALQAVRGRRVAVYWNDYNPDTDAVVYTIQNGKPHDFICAAKRLGGIDRFEASGKEMADEKRRKAQVHLMCASQVKSMAGHLQRQEKPIEVTTAQNDVQARLAAARARLQGEQAVKSQTARAVNDAQVNDDTIRAAVEPEHQKLVYEPLSSEQLKDILSPPPSDDAPDPF